MTITRRDFLRSGLAGIGTGIVPPALAQGVFTATADGVHNDHVLVVLQLGGGNDGLNTVIPYADSAYAQARPTIGVAPTDVLHLDDHIGLHPSLTGVKALYDRGHVAVVQGVGYPNPVYSHFEALRIWEYADPTGRATDGWLGKLLSGQLATPTNPLAGCALGQASTPSELRATGATVSVIDSATMYQIQGGAGRKVAVPALYRKTPGLYGALFDQALATAESGIAAVQSGASSYKPAAAYPTVKTVYGSKNQVASALELTAQMIVTQPGVKICHTVLGGFDTHFQQDTRHAALLSQIDAAVSAFMNDLAAHGQANRVVLVTWSEFGRRVAENASRGTDHGAAAPMLVIGAPVKGGLLGDPPSLAKTELGNLTYTTDFRSVYQSLIRDWLGGDPAPVLGGAFPNVKVVT